MSAPAVARSLSIFYDTFEVGGTQPYHLDGPVRHQRTLTEAVVTFGVLVQETTDAAFKTACEAVETAFRKRDVRLRIVLNSQTYPDYNPSTNSGFEQVASCVMGSSPNADTAYSRRYDVSITVQLPTPDLSGLLDINVSVDYDQAKIRTVSIRGMYLADGGSDATANYAAQIEAKCTSILSGLSPGGTFERTHELTDRDRVDKKIRFERTYLEIIFAQSSQGLDHPSIVQHVVGIEKIWEQPGDSGGGNVKRLERFRMRYSCWLDKTVTTDTASLLTGTILPYLKSLFVSRYSPSQYGIITEQHQHLPATNQVVGELEILAAISPTTLIESVVTQRFDEDSGAILTHPWDGQPFSAYVDRGKATRLRISTAQNRVLGSASPQQRAAGGSSGSGGTWGGAGVIPGADHIGIGPGGTEIIVPGGGDMDYDPSKPKPPGGGSSGGGGGGGGRWILRTNSSSATPRWIGQPGQTFQVTDTVDVVVEEWVTEPTGGGGGGGKTTTRDEPNTPNPRPPGETTQNG